MPEIFGRVSASSFSSPPAPEQTPRLRYQRAINTARGSAYGSPETREFAVELLKELGTTINPRNGCNPFVNITREYRLYIAFETLSGVRVTIELNAENYVTVNISDDPKWHDITGSPEYIAQQLKPIIEKYDYVYGPPREAEPTPTPPPSRWQDIIHRFQPAE